jgi:hypothetical protein
VADGSQPSPGHGGKREGAGRPKKEEWTRKKSPMRIVAEGIDETLKEIRRVGITEALMREVAVISLANLVHAARHGNIKAAMFLMDRVLKQPERQFADAVGEMSPDQIQDHMRKSLQSAGFTPEVAAGIIDTLMSAPVPEDSPLLQLPPVVGTIDDHGNIVDVDFSEDAE